MRNLKSISTLALATAISATLMLSGCGKKDKAATPKNAAKAVKNIEKVEVRKVSEAQAAQALSAACLGESGDSAFTWKSRDGEAGTYTFKGLTVEDAGDALSIGSLELVGMHMEGELAAFDKIVFNNISVDDDDVNFSADKIAVMEPSPVLANAFAQTLCGDDDAFEKLSGDISFGGFTMADIKFNADEGTGSIASLIIGHETEKTGMFSLKDMKLNVDADGEKVVLNLGSMDVTGMNMEKYGEFFGEAFKSGFNGTDITQDIADKISGSMNPYDPDYEHISMKDFNMNAAGMSLDFDSYVADMEKKGGKIISTQKMTPMTVKFDENASGDMAEMAEALTEFGYDELIFTMGGTTILDEKADSMTTEDTYFALKDGFTLSFDMEMTGYKDFMTKYNSMQLADNAGANAAMEMLTAMNFSDLTISFKDESILDKSFAFAAKEQGGSVAELKSQAKMGLAMMTMMAQDEAQQALAADAGKALTKLIDDGGTLVIRMQPKKGFNIADAIDGDIDVEKMGLSIKTK